MSLLCFSMDFRLTKEEENKTSHITWAAYDAWVLVNDYFSWEKEELQYNANGAVGPVANAVYLFMQWNSIDVTAARKLLRQEITLREDKFVQLRDKFLASRDSTPRLVKWLQLLEHVTAGNFVWSMTTARYRLANKNSYPALRAAQDAQGVTTDSLSRSITDSAAELSKQVDLVLGERTYLDRNAHEDRTSIPTSLIVRRHISSVEEEEENPVHSQISQIPALSNFEEVTSPSQHCSRCCKILTCE